MNKAKEILEQALSYKNCDGLIEENSRIEDVVLYAINEALRQPLVSGRSEQLVCEHPDEAIIRDKPTDYCLACNRNI